MSDTASDCSDCTEPRTAVTEPEVEALVRGICFKTGPPRTLGVEVEWLVHELRMPQLPVTPERLEAAYAALRTVPLRSALTVEPGGQLELSSSPAASLMECIGSVSEDLDAVRAVLRRDNLGLVGVGHDPWHPPRRFLHEPRYDAMERCLDRTGPAGRRMMCTSASVQVCLDAGYEEPGPLGLGRRWWLAHQLGAVLVAAFANSPAGRPQPHRLALHPAAHLDGDRSRPRGRSDPGRGTARRLDRPRPGRAGDVHTAGQRPVGRAGGTDVPGVDQIGLAETSDPRGSRLPRLDTVPAGQTARPSRTAHDRRAARGRRLDRAAGRDDGALRRPGGGRDRVPGREAAGRTDPGLPAPHNPLWIDAARYGLSDPELHEAALVCFAAALEALPRLGATAGVMDAVRAFFDRYVVRGRCPADDLLDRVRGTDSRPHGKDIRT